MKNLKNISILCCLLFVAVCMNAQNISGKLVDEYNQPLTYANVVLLSLPDSSFVSGTISDETGDFSLSKDEEGKLVRISSVGYITLYKEVTAGDLGTIRMTPDAKLLGEVVVKGNLPVTRAKGDAMVTTVTGTLLEKAGNANDLLDKIPNVSAGGGSVNVFGSGKAEVYINGRKMRSASELEQLSSDNIKSVEVVHTPGARYDAEVKAVSASSPRSRKARDSASTTSLPPATSGIGRSTSSLISTIAREALTWAARFSVAVRKESRRKRSSNIVIWKTIGDRSRIATKTIRTII